MSILILSCLSLIFLYVSSISIVFLLYQELWVPQYDLQLGLPGPGGWRCGDWDDPCLTWYNFYGHVNPETFWFLGRPVDARYDIAPMDQWHSVSRWMQIECCRIPFDLFLDPRSSTFRHTVEIWSQINFYIQNVSITRWLLASLAMVFLGTENCFHHLVIENRSHHFSPWVSNHVPRRCTNFGRLC